MSHGIGLGAVHTKKRDLEVTRSILWGIEVCTVSDSFTLPPAKMLRAQEFLASPDFDPAMARIPLKKIQELRGKHEHWSVCNRALSTELKHDGRLLVVRDGLFRRKAPCAN